MHVLECVHTFRVEFPAALFSCVGISRGSAIFLSLFFNHLKKIPLTEIQGGFFEISKKSHPPNENRGGGVASKIHPKDPTPFITAS